jgi:Protein of unknown function (DUF992)
MRKLALAAAALLGLAATPASAETGVKVGMLTCHIDGGLGYIIVSSKTLDCEYRGGSGRHERYEGRISKLGVDLGYTANSAFVWAVFAPGRTERGGLEGVYGGATAEATAIVGLGANVLIGGFEHTINLQPLSLQGQTGLNVAAGLAGLKLDYVGPYAK